MGLIERFTALFRREDEAAPPTTSDEVTPPPRPAAALRRFQAERGRVDIVRACRRMYDEDARGAGVIETLARDAVRGGFSVVVSEGSDPDMAQQIADDLADRLGLTARLDDWTRLALRDGDSFLELGVDAQGLVRDVSRKPTLEMHRNSDEFDRFADPEHAFWWSDQMWLQEAPDNATWFAAWQIVHARWGHDEGSRYGRPLFGSARTAYKRMSEGEFDVAVRRKTRAGMKYLHTLDGADENAIRRYKRENQDALNDPFAAVADFFTNQKAEIKAIQGDARLSEIEDVVHHIRTWWVASPVPMSLLGYGQDLNRDVLEQQQEQYLNTLDSVTGWVEDQLVRPILERQWLLQGVWPQGISYKIEWAVKQALTVQALKELGEALARLRATGLFDDEALLRMAARVVPGLDVEALIEALRKAQAERPYF